MVSWALTGRWRWSKRRKENKSLGKVAWKHPPSEPEPPKSRKNSRESWQIVDLRIQVAQQTYFTLTQAPKRLESVIGRVVPSSLWLSESAQLHLDTGRRNSAASWWTKQSHMINYSTCMHSVLCILVLDTWKVLHITFFNFTFSSRVLERWRVPRLRLRQFFSLYTDSLFDRWWKGRWNNACCRGVRALVCLAENWVAYICYLHEMYCVVQVLEAV